MVDITVPLELCEYGMNSATTAYASTYQRILMDSSNYDGAEYYFEIVVTNSNTTTAYDVGLRDITNNTTKVNISVPASTTRKRLWAGPFTPGSGNIVYSVYSPATASAGQVVVYNARILVTQINATKTRVQIPLLNRNYNDTAAYNAQYVENRNVITDGQSVSRYFSIFQYQANRYATVPTNGFTFESCTAGSSSNRISTVSLYNKTDNTIVASVSVSGTTPSVQSTSWSAGASNWHDGDEYEVRHKISSASYYSRPGNAYLYITLSSIDAIDLYWKISKARTAGTGALINEYQRANPGLNNTWWVGYAEVTGFCADNANRIHLQQDSTNDSGTGGSNVTNGDFNFNSATKVRQRTAVPFTWSGFTTRYIVDIDATTNNLELSTFFIVYTIDSTIRIGILDDTTTATETITPSYKNVEIADDNILDYRPYTINGSSTGAVTNYVVRITVSYDSAYMRTDFNNLRFYDNNFYNINYNKVSYVDGVSAIFDVKVPSIPQSSSTVINLVSTSNITDGSNPDYVYLAYFTTTGSSLFEITGGGIMADTASGLRITGDVNERVLCELINDDYTMGTGKRVRGEYLTANATNQYSGVSIFSTIKPMNDAGYGWQYSSAVGIDEGGVCHGTAGGTYVKMGIGRNDTWKYVHPSAYCPRASWFSSELLVSPSRIEATVNGNNMGISMGTLDSSYVIRPAISHTSQTGTTDLYVRNFYFMDYIYPDVTVTPGTWAGKNSTEEIISKWFGTRDTGAISEDVIGGEETTPIDVSDSTSDSELLTTDIYTLISQSSNGAETASLKNTLTTQESYSIDEAILVANLLAELDSGSSAETLAHKLSVTLSDALAGSETLLLKIFIALIETRTATDTLNIIAYLDPQKDHATGADSAGSLITLAQPETGSGSEAPALKVGATVTQASSGAETLSQKNTFTTPDSATASELAILRWFGALSDNITPADQIALKNAITAFETVNGTDLISIVARALLSENITPTETVILKNFLSTQDTGSLADVLSILYKISIADADSSITEALTHKLSTVIAETATGTDTALLEVFLTLSETGSATESLLALTDYFTITQTSNGNETISTKAVFTIDETTSDIESLSIANRFALTETKSLTDAAILKVITSAVESGTGVDQATMGAFISQLENASGVDVVSSAMQVLQSESLSTSEALSLMVFLSLADTAQGSDSASALMSSNVLSVSDAGSLVDAISILTRFVMSDTGSGVDSSSTNIVMPVSDSGTDTDIVIASNKFSQVDSSTSSDLLMQKIFIPIDDLSSVTEALLDFKKAFYIEDKAINLLDPNVISGTDLYNSTQGFTRTGTATITSDTSYFYQGLRSLRLATGTNGLGFITTNSTPIESNTYYAFSVYARSNTAKFRLTFTFKNSSNEIVQEITSTENTGSSTWTRYSLISQSPSDATQVSVGIVCSTNNVLYLYADCFQLERGDTVSEFKYPFGVDNVILTKHFIKSDSVAGVDTASLYNYITQLESATGVDIISLAIQALQSDAITSSEALTLATFITLYDTGAGADTASTFTVGDFREITDTSTIIDTINIIARFLISESGSGTETPTLSTAQTIQDTSSATESLAQRLAGLLSDSVSGSEALAIKAIIAQLETATGTDLLTLSIYALLSDTLTPTEQLQLKTFLGLTDTTTATDTAGQHVSTQASDTGSGADIPALLAHIPATDSGAGTELLGLLKAFGVSDNVTGVDIPSLSISLTAMDNGSITDLVSLVAELIIEDSSTGVDIPTISGYLQLLDNVSFTDLISLVVRMTQTDTATVVDTISKFVGSDFRTITDTAFAIESVNLVVELLLSDNSTTVDAFTTSVALVAMDSGSITELVTIVTEFLLSDSSAGVDIPTIANYLLTQDSISTVDLVSLLVRMAASDTASATESTGVKNMFSALDSSSAVDLLALLARVVTGDVGGGVDTDTISTFLTQMDNATAGELVSLIVRLAVSEAANGVDVENVHYLLEVFKVMDNTILNDVIAVYNTFTASDTANATEAAELIKRLITEDNATLTDIITITKVAFLVSEIINTTDTPLIHTASSVIDTQGLSDVISILNRFLVSDVETVSEIAYTTKASTIGDSGDGEDIPVLNEYLEIFENSSGAENLIMTIESLLSDSVSSSEILALLNEILFEDTVIGVDVASLYNKFIINDMSALDDVLNLLVNIRAVDIGITSSILDIKNTFILNDNLSYLLEKSIINSDSGLVFDGGNVIEHVTLNTFLSIIDSVVGTELAHLGASIDLNDSTIGSEVLALAIKLLLSDDIDEETTLDLTNRIVEATTGVLSERIAIYIALQIYESIHEDSEIGITTHTYVADDAEGEEATGAGRYVSDDGTLDTIISMILNKMTVNDNVTIAEEISLAIATAITDQGTITETLRLLKQFSVTDMGHGYDLATIPGGVLQILDIGASIEALEVKLSSNVIDTSSITEELAQIIHATITDNIQSTEIINLIISLILTDTSETIEETKQTLSTQITDTPEGIDQIQLLIQTIINDNLIGTETPTVQNSFKLNDNLSPIEALQILNIFKEIDASTSIDDIIIKNALLLSDTLNAYDILINKISIFLSDLLTDIEITTLKNSITESDLGTGDEGAVIGTYTQIVDETTGSEDLTYKVNTQILDNVTGFEDLLNLVRIKITEAETLIDIATKNKFLNVADIGATVDAVNELLVSIRVFEDSFGSEGPFLFKKYLTIEETFNALEIVTRPGEIQDSSIGIDSTTTTSKPIIIDQGITDESIRTAMGVNVYSPVIGSEQIYLSNFLSVKDIVSSDDSLSAIINIPIPDDGEIIENIAFKSIITPEDMAIIQEGLSLFNSFTIRDEGVGEELPIKLRLIIYYLAQMLKQRNITATIIKERDTTVIVPTTERYVSEMEIESNKEATIERVNHIITILRGVQR